MIDTFKLMALSDGHDESDIDDFIRNSPHLDEIDCPEEILGEFELFIELQQLDQLSIRIQFGLRMIPLIGHNAGISPDHICSMRDFNAYIEKVKETRFENVEAMLKDFTEHLEFKGTPEELSINPAGM